MEFTSSSLQVCQLQGSYQDGDLRGMSLFLSLIVFTCAYNFQIHLHLHQQPTLYLQYTYIDMNLCDLCLWLVIKKAFRMFSRLLPLTTVRNGSPGRGYWCRLTAYAMVFASSMWGSATQNTQFLGRWQSAANSQCKKVSYLSTSKVRIFLYIWLHIYIRIYIYIIEIIELL